MASVNGGAAMTDTVTDYNGSPLHEGDPVWAWLEGVRFAAKVAEICPPRRGDGYRVLVLTKDEDGSQTLCFSDAVAVRSEDDSGSEEE
jgi:hypothetical protein